MLQISHRLAIQILFCFQPSEEEESDDLTSNEETDTDETERQATEVMENIPETEDQNSNNILASTSQDETQSDTVVTSVAADSHSAAVTSDITFQQGKVETTDSDSQTIIGTSQENGAVSDDSVQYQSEELDDSSLSLDSTEACSESTSQTFYSPVSSSCVTPEPKPSGSVTFAVTQAPESAEAFAKLMEVASQERPLELPENVMPLPDFTKCSGGSISSSKDVGEDAKGKGKFSNFFQIKKKSQSQKS
jgi:hypothetical protein